MRRFLKSLYAGWMKFAHVLGVVNTAVLLTLVYVLLAGPLSLYLRLTGRQPAKPSFWTPRAEPDPAFPERRRLRFQF